MDDQNQKRQCNYYYPDLENLLDEILVKMVVEVEKRKMVASILMVELVRMG